MGSGKTDWSLRLAEEAMKKRPGIQIISNIRNTRPVKGYRFCNSLRELLRAMIDVNHGLLILDEAGIFGSSGASTRRKEVGQWEQFVKLSRKFGLATIWIDQRVKGSVLPTMRDLAKYRFHKPKKFICEIYQGGHEDDPIIDRLKLTSKDRTTLPFDTLDIGSFRMDLPEIIEMVNGKEKARQLTIRDVFDHLSKFRSSEVRSELRKWLDEIETKADKRAEDDRENLSEEDGGVTKRDLIRAILEIHQPANTLEYPRNVDLIKVLDVTDQYVRSVKKEWLKERAERERDESEEIDTGRHNTPARA
jgi:hypothetical protein